MWQPRRTNPRKVDHLLAPNELDGSTSELTLEFTAVKNHWAYQGSTWSAQVRIGTLVTLCHIQDYKL